MNPLPTPLEEAAKAVEQDLSRDMMVWVERYTGPHGCDDDAPEPPKGNYRSTPARLATAAITAYLAQAEKEGWVMMPTNATAQMIAAAFPSTDRDVLSSEDLKTGAAAIMILEGPADLGAITGPAVKEAAAMCKDYRAMLAAAQNGGEPCK